MVVVTSPTREPDIVEGNFFIGADTDVALHVGFEAGVDDVEGVVARNEVDEDKAAARFGGQGADLPGEVVGEFDSGAGRSRCRQNRLQFP